MSRLSVLFLEEKRKISFCPRKKNKSQKVISENLKTALKKLLELKLYLVRALVIAKKISL